MKYGCTPGKYFQLKRLQRAKELLETRKVKASDIYLDFGYENLSNFSAALKNTFGLSPRQLKAAGATVLY
jgi:AraC-like DNA-binding protein